jgi:glutamate-1-semialdehyde 2,1-aminomutase
MESFRTPKSDEMAEVGRQVIPGAMMSNFRRDAGYHPIYITHGAGARVYDVDENEYIDYSLSYGPAILGHSNEHVRNALKNELDRLYVPNPNDLEVRAAQKVSQHIGSAELVRFACSGTEANRGALRVARAFTGRDMYVRFNGHYHGGLDHLMGGIIVDPDFPVPVEGELEGDYYSTMAMTAGRYEGAFNQAFMIEYNDLPALEKLFHNHSERIAAVILEPTMVNNFGCMPEPGYLESLRELCTGYGIVLIFDEVLTGFRIDLKGAQGYFGIKPDMTTLGKALGAGFPVSSFNGKREIMDLLTRTEVVQGGTYNGHPMAMAAVIATIEELEKDEGAAFEHIRRIGTLLKEGIDNLAQEYGEPLLLQGFPGAWTFCFSDKSKIISQADGYGSDFERTGWFSALLKERGVLTSFRFCTSVAHTEEDVEDTLDRIEDAFKVMSHAG